MGKLLKSKILRSDLNNNEIVESLQEQIELFKRGNKITLAEYNELILILQMKEA